MEGNYLAGRVEGCFRVLLHPVILTASVGYRFSDAKAIKGRPTLNAQVATGEFAVTGRKAADIGFDFSGALFRVGLAVEF